MAVRTTQSTARVLNTGAAGVRVPQSTVRVLNTGAAGARVSQVTVRVLSNNDDVPTGRRRRVIVIGG